MKTGRIRQKEQPPAGGQGPSTPAEPALGVTAPAPPGRRIPIIGLLVGAFVCLALILLSTTLFRGRTREWVEATRANGEWMTVTTVFGPQLRLEERWQADCTNDPACQVRPGTCILKDSSTYNDRLVDEYDEYAYNLYYEETYQQLYEARGTEFTVTSLGGDDWWEGNRHFVKQERLDQDTCQLTNYTVWVDDPQDKSQEVEVYLSDCEVWDHVTVYERVYDRQLWCQCDVTVLMQIGQQSAQGTGLDVRWPDPAVPAGGRSERSFQGKVTFLGSDYTFTVTTQELSRYQDYLTGQYYIGLKDGRPVTVSNPPPKK